MKYVMMFVHRPDLDASVPSERSEQVYKEIYGWFEEHGTAGRLIEGGAELQPQETATTVKGDDNGNPVVIDGPFSEAKEVVGGFTIADVPDLDTAIEMAKGWPSLKFAGVAVEIRPIVDHSEG